MEKEIVRLKDLPKREPLLSKRLLQKKGTKSGGES